MGRYNKYRIIVNNGEYYKPLRDGRNVKQIVQYETPRLHNPTVRQRANTLTTKHIWKYGDRLYNLADQYYGDSRYWWVIAWYNGFGAEADIYNGALIRISLNIEDALKVLGAV